MASAALASCRSRGRGFSANVARLMLSFDAVIGFYFIVVRWATAYVSPYQLLFWALVGNQAAACMLLLSKKTRASSISCASTMGAAGWSVKLAGAVFSIAGVLALYIAVSMNNAATVSALSGIQPFLVFLYAAAASYAFPREIKEDLGTGSLLAKGAACMMIMAGCLLLVL
jgi:drug/metabolite transporter (DMT)-like permease